MFPGMPFSKTPLRDVMPVHMILWIPYRQSGCSSSEAHPLGPCAPEHISCFAFRFRLNRLALGIPVRFRSGAGL